LYFLFVSFLLFAVLLLAMHFNGLLAFLVVFK